MNRTGRIVARSALVLALAAGAVGLVSCGKEPGKTGEYTGAEWAQFAKDHFEAGRYWKAKGAIINAELADPGDQYADLVTTYTDKYNEISAEPVDANPEFSARYDISGVVDGYLMLTAGTTEREGGMWGVAEQIYCTTNNIAFGDVDFSTREVKREIARIFGGIVSSNMGMESQRAEPNGDGFRLRAEQVYRVPEEVLR